MVTHESTNWCLDISIEKRRLGNSKMLKGIATGGGEESPLQVLF